MTPLITLPIKIMGWTAAGVALAVGWKIGSYIVNAAARSTDVQRFFEGMKARCQPGEPLWKRQFTKISEE